MGAGKDFIALALCAGFDLLAEYLGRILIGNGI